MPEKLKLVKKADSIDYLTINLSHFMQLKDINEAELARKTGIPQPTLHKILTGKTEDPRASTLKVLAGFFEVTIDDLLSESCIASNHSMKSKKVQSIPIISWSDCVTAKSFIKTLSPSNWNNWIVSEFLSSNAYGLTSKPSMEPRFPKDTIFIIDPDIPPDDGDLVVVHYPNTDQATIRKLSADGPTKLLLSICSDIAATNLNNEIKLLGVLIKSIFSFHN